MTAKKSASPKKKPTGIDLDAVLAERQSPDSKINVRLFGLDLALTPLTQIDLRAFTPGISEAEQAMAVMESMLGPEQLARIPAGSLTAEVAAIIIDAVAEAQMETAPLERSASTVTSSTPTGEK